MQRKALKLKRLYLPIIFLVSALIYLVLAVYKIKKPGLYYDELDFVNAALGGIGNSFIYARLFGIPVMIMPYIGSLKSFLFYPIFHIFGVSALTIRLPMILLTCATLFMVYKLATLIFNKNIYVIFTMFLSSTDPALIFQTKLDWGPIAIQLFLSTSILFAFFKALKSQPSVAVKIWLPIIYVSLILGLYNKLNFVWFLSAFILSSVLLYRSHIKEWIRVGLLFWLPLVGFLGITFAVSFFLILPILSLNTANSLPFLQKVVYTFHLYINTINGSAVYNFITNKNISVGSIFNYGFLISFVLWIISLIINFILKNRTYYMLREILFFSSMFILILLQIIFTKQATGPYHIMTVWPIEIILLVLFLSAFIHSFSIYSNQQSIKIVRTVLYVGVLMVIISQLNTDTAYLNAFSSDANFSFKWSPNIYELSKYVNKQYYKHHINFVISSDWGTANQIFALSSSSQQRLNTIDAWGWFTNGSHSTLWPYIYKTYFQDKKVMLIRFSGSKEVIPGTRKNLNLFITRYGLRYKELKIPKQDSTYEILYIKN